MSLLAILATAAVLWAAAVVVVLALCRAASDADRALEDALRRSKARRPA